MVGVLFACVPTSAPIQLVETRGSNMPKRAVGQTIELTREFKYKNYTEVLTRMYAEGLVSKEKVKEMLSRVETLVGEESV